MKPETQVMAAAGLAAELTLGRLVEARRALIQDPAEVRRKTWWFPVPPKVLAALEQEDLRAIRRRERRRAKVGARRFLSERSSGMTVRSPRASRRR